MKTKTAAFILNCNLPDYTDWLYESLKPFERDDYDLFVIDNGSTPEGRSKYTTFQLLENVYFGGGFHAAMDFTIQNKQYDSMMFLNNDLTIHPYNFVRSLRNIMKHDVGDPLDSYRTELIDFDVVSPCFYNVEPNKPCHWKTMHGYGSTRVREVPYVDFQCPLISRRLLTEIKEIDGDLMYGFGIDFLFALACQRKGWKIGVSDWNCILHHNSMTVKKGVAKLDIPTYCRLAEQGQYNFFSKGNMMGEYMELRKKAENYTYTE